MATNGVIALPGPFRPNISKDKIVKRTVMTLAALALISSAASAGPGPGQGGATKSTPKSGTLVCPVMRSKIASQAKAAGKSVYKGKTYYFCCAACKPMFDKNPAKYVKGANK